MKLETSAETEHHTGRQGFSGPIQEVDPKKHRPPAPRFLVADAGAEWEGQEILAGLCEKSGLSEFQAAAALECAQGGDATSFAKRQGCSLFAARKRIHEASRGIQRELDFCARKNRYWRDLLDCMRAGEGGSGPRPLVGLMPWVDTENHETWQDYLSTLREPRNYRTVPLRSRIITEHDLGHSSQAVLQEAFR